jgi:hypothetical protein
MATTFRYKSYAERYADNERDPFKKQFAGIMGHFQAPTTGAEKTSTMNKIERGVWDTIETQPHAYLALAGDVDKGDDIRVYVYHRPTKLVPPLGSNREVEHYVFAGDVVRHHAPTTIYWPEEAFKKSAQVTVPSGGILDAAFAADQDLDIVGPFNDGEAGTEVVCTRPLMYLPPPYISAALAHSPMTARKAWEIIGGSIRTDPEAERLTKELKPLLDWLKVACTRTPLPGIGPENLLSYPAVVFPQPEGFLDLIENTLDREVPHWRGSREPPTGVESVAAAVNSLTDRIRDNQEEALRRNQEAVDKSPSKYWGDATLIVNRITWTSTPDALPELWHVIAKSSKTNLRILITEHLRVVAQDMGMEGAAPVVTPSLSKKLATLQFSHPDIDNLDDGIQPFVVGVRSKKEQANLKSYIGYYDSILEGGAAPGLKDLQDLSQKDKVAMPKTLLQAQTTLRSFHVLLRAMLPESHDLVIQFARFCTAFNRKLLQLEENSPGQNFPAQIVRFLQIRISNWFTEQEENSWRVTPPDFMDLLTRIQNRDSSWVPALPGLQTPLEERPKPGKPAPDPEKPSGTKKRDPETPTETKGKGDRANNTAYDEAFTFYKSKGIPLKKLRENALAANHPVPQGAHGEMCLSYHILGFCWSNCARNAGHQPLSAPDKEKLVNWCREVYV